MSIIHEVATMTAKGQITLPKPIRQALGVDVGAKVAFELHENGQVVVSRAGAEHEDPAIGAFLDLLAGDIQAGRHIQGSPTIWYSTCSNMPNARCDSMRTSTAT